MKDSQSQSKTNDDLSVVRFGASAGGFEAYCTILSLLPADTGLAFIIVHHQPADVKSLLCRNSAAFYEDARGASGGW